MSRRTAEAVSAAVLFCHMEVAKTCKSKDLHSMVCLTGEQTQGVVFRWELVESTPAMYPLIGQNVAK